MPGRFEAVGEALVAGRTATDACEVVGRLQGSQGVSLEETLADLRTTYELVLGTEPAFTDACAVALGWSEATLAYLHQLSCADPLTGLASMAHLRGRLTELYRGDTRGPAPSATATRWSSSRQRRRVSPGSPTRSSASTCGCPGSGSPHARCSPAARRLPDRPTPDRGPCGPRPRPWPRRMSAPAQPARASGSAPTAASGSGPRACPLAADQAVQPARRAVPGSGLLTVRPPGEQARCGIPAAVASRLRRAPTSSL